MNNKQKHDKKYCKLHYYQTLVRIKKEYEDLIKDRAKDLSKSVNEYIVD